MPLFSQALLPYGVYEWSLNHDSDRQLYIKAALTPQIIYDFHINPHLQVTRVL